jgi:DNA-directed RNA polymerase subunit RPC12/RpoP
MSHHEFLCHDCHKGFLKTLTRHDYEEGEVTCPHCGSDRVELRVTLPDAATKKSAQGRDNEHAPLHCLPRPTATAPSCFPAGKNMLGNVLSN